MTRKTSVKTTKHPDLARFATRKSGFLSAC